MATFSSKTVTEITTAPCNEKLGNSSPKNITVTCLPLLTVTTCAASNKDCRSNCVTLIYLKSCWKHVTRFHNEKVTFYGFLDHFVKEHIEDQIDIFCLVGSSFAFLQLCWCLCDQMHLNASISIWSAICAYLTFTIYLAPTEKSW